MKDIKTRDHNKTIRTLDKAAVAHDRMKNVAIRAKENAVPATQDDTENTTDYGVQEARNVSEDAVYTAKRAASSTVQKNRRENRPGSASRDHAERDNTESPTASTRQAPASKNASSVNYTSRGKSKKFGSPAGQKSQEKTKKSNNPTEQSREKAKGAIKERRTEAGPKTRGAATNRPKGKTTRIKTPGSSSAAETVKGTAGKQHAIASAQSSAARAKYIANTAARASAKGAKAAVAAAKKYAALVIAKAKSLVAAIAAGGSTAAFVVILICMIGLIAASAFGILFSGEDTGNGQTLRDAISEINQEYEAQLESIRNSNPHDVVEMTGSRAVWRDVLSVYAVRTTTDPDNPQEVVSMDDTKKELLRNIFWEMNTITSRTETATRTVTTESADESGNIVVETQEVEQTVLYITVTHKTPEEMAASYSFNSNQNEQLTELLSPDYASLWNAALYGITASDTAIVDVALSQIGNVGGQPYWSWYGFGSRVEWCACFVSWCANECGYIDNGIIPKYSYCPTGADWFKQRGQWAERDITPEPGMIIFFDWARGGRQDGETDHTGIVEKVEDGRVYTIEGNSSNSCRERSYPIGWYEIYGYGVPAY